MSGTTATGRQRTDLTPEQITHVDKVRSVSATIQALEAQLARLYPERVGLYRAGVDLGVPKVRMADAAGVTPEAIIHAIRKAETEEAARGS